MMPDATCLLQNLTNVTPGQVFCRNVWGGL